MTNTTIVNHETTASFCPEAMGFECTISPISYVNGTSPMALGALLQQHGLGVFRTPAEDGLSINERWDWVHSSFFPELEVLIIKAALLPNYQEFGEACLEDWLRYYKDYYLREDLWKHFAECWPDMPCDFVFYCCEELLSRLYDGRYTHLFEKVDSDVNWKEEGF